MLDTILYILAAILTLLLIITIFPYAKNFKKLQRQKNLEEIVFGLATTRSNRSNQFINLINKYAVNNPKLNVFYMHVLYVLFDDICTLRKHNKDNVFFLVIPYKYIVLNLTQIEWLSDISNYKLNQSYIDDSIVVSRFECLNALFTSNYSDIAKLPRSIIIELAKALEKEACLMYKTYLGRRIK